MVGISGRLLYPKLLGFPPFLGSDGANEDRLDSGGVGDRQLRRKDRNYSRSFATARILVSITTVNKYAHETSAICKKLGLGLNEVRRSTPGRG